MTMRIQEGIIVPAQDQQYQNFRIFMEILIMSLMIRFRS